LNNRKFGKIQDGEKMTVATAVLSRNHKKFGTAINCMDGRTQLPVLDWVKKNYDVDYVDMITEAGADKILAESLPENLELINKINKVKSRYLSKYSWLEGCCDSWASRLCRQPCFKGATS
jgi:S-methylmethionine-dependent homocysteine/selenocysteine methylase